MAANIERDIPFLQHGKGPDSWTFFDDFNDLNFSATVGLAKWTMVEDTGGSTELLSLTQPGGVLEFTPAAADDEVTSLHANSGVTVNALRAGESVFFGIRFKISAGANDNHIYAGLGIKDDDYTSNPADFCMFQVVEGSASLNLVCSKDSSATTGSAIATVANNTWVRAFFKYTPTTVTDIGTLEYIVHSNGTRTTGSINTNGNFPDDVVIFPIIQVVSGSTDQDVTSVDWIYAYASRADYTDGTG